MLMAWLCLHSRRKGASLRGMWRDDYITAKEDAEGAEMRAAMASMDAGKEKQMQRFMMKFAGDQAKVFAQSCIPQRKASRSIFRRLVAHLEYI